MTKTILVLAANPRDTARLRLDQEVRGIESGLKRAYRRDQFTLKSMLAARPEDVRRAMLDFKPNIVHFCGHGAGKGGIAFEDETGNTKLVSAAALAGFFKLFSDKVECVVLNACYSEVQAEAIAEHIDYVIGMQEGIGDTAAIEFAVAFYDALGAGESIEFAYELACNAIHWEGASEYLTPVLKSNPRIKERRACIYVLIVDDDDDCRQRLSQILKTIDCETIEAKTNAQAAEFLFSSDITFSLVTTDALRRPERYGEKGYVGLDLIRTVNARFPDLPVVLVSRDPPQWLKAKAPSLRISALISKEFSDRETLAVIQKVLDGETLSTPWVSLQPRK